jgi:FtsZ-binding cell division protein ZapB
MKRNRDNENEPMEEAEILARLSERVEKAVGTIQELRREREQLLARIAELEGGEEEQERLRRERGEIRERIENILASLEALE